VAGHALRGDLAERAERRAQVAGGGGLVHFERKAARRLVHLGADRLHPLGHERRHVLRAVQPERAQAQPVLGQLARLVEAACAERVLDLLQGREVVAHVAHLVLEHHGRELDELARILGVRRGCSEQCE